MSRLTHISHCQQLIVLSGARGYPLHVLALGFFAASLDVFCELSATTTHLRSGLYQKLQFGKRWNGCTVASSWGPAKHEVAIRLIHHPLESHMTHLSSVHSLGVREIAVGDFASPRTIIGGTSSTDRPASSRLSTSQRASSRSKRMPGVR
jgi:hypothetical protein